MRTGRRLATTIGTYFTFWLKTWAYAGHHKIHDTPSHGWAETTESTTTQTFHNMLKWEHHKIDYYKWGDVGLQVQCCNKAAIFTIQVKIMPNAEKSKTEQITCEDHANFLQLWMFDELWAYSQRSAKESINLTIWQCLWPAVCKEQLGLRQEHSSFLPPQQCSCTNMPSSRKFLSQQTKIYSHSISHPTTLTCLQQALSCSQNSKLL